MTMNVVREREQWGKGWWYVEFVDTKGNVAWTSEVYPSRRAATVDAVAESFLRGIEVL